MEEYGGVTVTYRRPGVFSFRVVAVPGRNPVDIYDQNGVMLRGQVQDFTIAIEKLKVGMAGGIQRPLRGDEIVMAVKTDTIVFMVSGEDVSTSHYESSDSYGVAWRIHTKSDRRV
jgi:hypothetical protein